MAASLVLAGREAGHKEADSLRRCGKLHRALCRPDARLRRNAASRGRAFSGASARLGTTRARRAVEGGARHTPAYARAAYRAGRRQGRARLVASKKSKPMLTRVTGAKAEAVLASLGPYSDMLEPQRQHLLSLYQPVDVAFKVVGTGSVGLRDYCIYFEGNGPRTRCFCRSRKRRLRRIRRICRMHTRLVTMGSVQRRGSAPCRCSRIRFWVGRTWAGATTWCAS